MRLKKGWNADGKDSGEVFKSWAKHRVVAASIRKLRRDAEEGK